MTKNIIVTAAVALVVSVVAGFTLNSGSSQSTEYGSLSQRDIKAITIDVQDDATFRKDIVLKDPTFCIDFYATSTATQNKMTASSTATIEGVDGVMLLGYGSCQ